MKRWMGMPMSAVLALTACVTINVYFPAAEAKEAAKQFVEKVIGDEAQPAQPTPEQPKPEQPKPDGGMAALMQFDPLMLVGISPAYAQGAPDITIKTPAIQAIQSRMESRFDASLRAGFDSGALGFTQDGLVVVRDASKVELKDRVAVNQAVADDNRDRKAVYREVAVANGHAEWNPRSAASSPSSGSPAPAAVGGTRMVGRLETEVGAQAPPGNGPPAAARPRAVSSGPTSAATTSPAARKPVHWQRRRVANHVGGFNCCASATITGFPSTCVSVARIDQTPFQIQITSLTHDGRGVGRRAEGQADAGKTVFVSGALPGEIVMAQQTGRQRSFDEARAVEVLQASADRVVPRCAHFGTCGGCALQHLDEAQQIHAKQRVLLENFERIGHVTPETRAAAVDRRGMGLPAQGPLLGAPRGKEGQDPGRIP